MKYKDIQEDATLYDKHHEVRVIAKTNHVDAYDIVVPDVLVEYVNQPAHWSPKVVGDGNLSEVPIHCWNCKRELIDNVYLNICPKCRRVVCTDINCAKCHCDTTWDPNK